MSEIWSAERFLVQNDIAAATLTFEDVYGLAEHHAGGLYVLLDYAPDGRCVKLHDTWGDPADGLIVVHTYDPDNPDDPNEREDYFTTGREALDHFWSIVGEA